MSRYSGVEGKVEVGATTLKVSKWDADISNDVQESTTFESAGWEENLKGVSHAEGSVEGDWDDTQEPYASPPAIKAGDLITVKLYLSRTGSKFFTFSARVSSTPYAADIKGKVTYSFKFRSNGPVTYPV